MTRKPCLRSRDRKRKLKSYGEAIHTALKMSMKYGIPFEIYHCEGTQHWHVIKKRREGK